MSVNNSANHERLLNFLIRRGRVLLQKLGPTEGASPAIFPEVCAVPEPVVDVFAACDVIAPVENGFANLLLAAVVCEDEGRREHRRSLTVMLPDLVVLGNEAVFAQERARRLRGLVYLVAGLLDDLNLGADLGSAALGNNGDHGVQ